MMVPFAHLHLVSCECVGEPNRDDGVHHYEVTADKQTVICVPFQVNHDFVSNVTVEVGTTYCLQESADMKYDNIQQEQYVVKKGDQDDAVELDRPVLYGAGRPAGCFLTEDANLGSEQGWPCQACRRWLCGCCAVCVQPMEVEKILEAWVGRTSRITRPRCRLLLGMLGQAARGGQYRNDDVDVTESQPEEHDGVWMMQRGKGKDNKRRRAPTPRRRRIPARGRPRQASWTRTTTRPTCSESWVDVPWRRGRGRSSREPEPDEEEEPTVNLTAASSAPAEAPPLPPFEDGIRTWGELIGVLDPMDEPESVIDPLVVENGVDRIRRMGSEERGQLAIQLVRFLAILYAEILRMLQLAEEGEGASLLQLPGPDLLTPSGLPITGVKNVEDGEDVDREKGEVQLMQTMPDKFGPVLQKLLGLLEKLDQPTAAVRARFLRSMLMDVQRPGLHISAAVIDKMDRLQALLLSFEEEEIKETTDEDREWSFSQWEVIKPILLDKQREVMPNTQPGGCQQAMSSTDIVCLEDSQEPMAEVGGQVAVLPDGSRRSLTKEEMEEIAYHEELEASAAEREARADEQRWLEFRAQCLREQEEQDMREALEESVTEHTDKKARVMIQVEGEGGRVVRSEVFNMVVKDGEALTYKIMVLPRDDPEVRALRRQQEGRESGVPAAAQANAEHGEHDESNVSAASADTLPTDEAGRLLPEPAVVSNEDLENFMKTEEGKCYYQKWLKGEITCKMVRERSGCGLLAKFFGKKVEDAEDQDMLQVALQVEHEQGHNQPRGSREGQAGQQAPSATTETPAEACHLSTVEHETEVASGAAAGDVPAGVETPNAVETVTNDNEDGSTTSATETADRAVSGQSTLKHWLT